MNSKPVVFIVLMIWGCKEKYVVHTNTPAAGFLVVEGFINLSGTTSIRLTRSSGLDSPMIIPEPGALVQVQSVNGAIYPLTETSGGYYSDSSMFLDPAQQYRIHIQTANGKEYFSDLSVAKITPAIDSVTWTASSTAVNIFVTTHDKQSQPGYYQWQYDETWKYHSAYASVLEYENEQIVIRPDSEDIFYCWHNLSSTNIRIANTEKLSENVIYKYLLTEIPYSASNRLSDTYSILVRQYSLTSDWYNWNQKIKKNTEQLGSIFDAQPSESSGNIHSITNPSELVIGFIGCTTETQQRIFIRRSELPAVSVYSGYETCMKDTISKDSFDVQTYFGQGSYLPVQQVFLLGRLYGYSISTPYCVDCRLQGGITTKPSFWP